MRKGKECVNIVCIGMKSCGEELLRIVGVKRLLGIDERVGGRGHRWLKIGLAERRMLHVNQIL